MSRGDRARLPTLLSAAVIAVTAAGCVNERIRRPASGIDPCRNRLHELSAQLLEYYALHRELPPTADHLAGGPGSAEVPPPVCPVTGQPYVYLPEGLESPSREGRLVLFEAKPGHGDIRWGIAVSRLPGGAGLLTEVIAVDDTWVARVEPEPAPRP